MRSTCDSAAPSTVELHAPTAGVEDPKIRRSRRYGRSDARGRSGSSGDTAAGRVSCCSVTLILLRETSAVDNAQCHSRSVACLAHSPTVAAQPAARSWLYLRCGSSHLRIFDAPSAVQRDVDDQRPRSRSGTNAGASDTLSIAVVVLAAAAAAWWLLQPVAVRTASRRGPRHAAAGVARDRLNLVIVTLDTTRADRIGAYGSARRRDAGVRSARARGRAVRAGGVGRAADAAGALQHLHRQVPARARRPRQRRLLPRPGTAHARRSAQGARLPDRRRSSPPTCSTRKWGINQGFDTYFDDFDLEPGARRVARRDPAAGQRGRGQGAAVDRAVGKARRSSRGFTSTTRTRPYRPPEPFATRYKDHPYNGEIAFADCRSARLVSQLQSLGLYDRTVVVVMGDHGESLGRPRRGRARLLRLQQRDARAVRHPRAVQPDARIAASPIRSDRWT